MKIRVLRYLRYQTGRWASFVFGGRGGFISVGLTIDSWGEMGGKTHLEQCSRFHKVIAFPFKHTNIPIQRYMGIGEGPLNNNKP